MVLLVNFPKYAHSATICHYKLFKMDNQQYIHVSAKRDYSVNAFHYTLATLQSTPLAQISHPCNLNIKSKKEDD